ncbi:pseudouridine synthase [Aerophototrophica crusticola]|uniref:pseudouridine synthase n=1 Tax=Aerophototrophica crusticola TaxID=1709002 RepID=UPI00384E1190
MAKRLARSGVCSRRDAERLIGEGRVAVNGRRLDTPAFLVRPGDRITVDNHVVPDPEPSRVWRYHKPDGLVTTARDELGRPTVFERLPPEMPRVVSVGRLDLSSEGLLLLTNDGELARHLELPATGWLRRYRVRVFGTPSADHLKRLADGLVVDGVAYGSIEATVDRTVGHNSWLTVGLREGKNREVRTVMEYLGFPVSRLIRTAYGPFQLGKLERGAVEEVPRRILRDQLPAFFPKEDRTREAAISGASAPIMRYDRLPASKAAGAAPSATKGGARPSARIARESAERFLRGEPRREAAPDRPRPPRHEERAARPVEQAPAAPRAGRPLTPAEERAKRMAEEMDRALDGLRDDEDEGKPRRRPAARRPAAAPPEAPARTGAKPFPARGRAEGAGPQGDRRPARPRAEQPADRQDRGFQARGDRPARGEPRPARDGDRPSRPSRAGEDARPSRRREEGGFEGRAPRREGGPADAPKPARPARGANSRSAKSGPRPSRPQPPQDKGPGGSGPTRRGPGGKGADRRR